MALLIPLIVMMLALAAAWVLGTTMRDQSSGLQKVAGFAGVASLFLLPLGYDAMIFDGNCPAVDGTQFPCALGERLNKSFNDGFVYMLAPALMWAVIYSMALNAPRSKS